MTLSPSRTLEMAGAGRPARLLEVTMDALFMRALRPDHASCADFLTPAARWLLYVRSHYLRMPLPLLLRHLLHKAVVSPKTE